MPFQPPDDPTPRSLQAALLQSHAAAVPVIAAASLTVGAVLLLTLHASAAPAALAGWAAALAAALLLRSRFARSWRSRPAALAAAAQRHAGEASHPGHPGDPAAEPVDETAGALWRPRAALLLQGLVWGSAALLPADLRPPGIEAVLILTLGGLTAGVLAMTLFDRRAALLFALPALLPLALRLGVEQQQQPTAVGAVAAVMLVALLAMYGAAARRTQRESAALAAARCAEAEGAAGARRAEELLHLIFDHIGEGIGVFDGQQRLLAWNCNFAEFLGLDATGLHAGLLLPDCLTAADAAATLADESAGPALLQGGGGAVQHTRADGRSVEVRRRPTPGGGVIIVCVDITERQVSQAALAEQQRMLALLLTNTEEGFWFIDNELRTTDVNPAMCRMLGVGRQQMLGRTIFEFVDADNAAIFRRQTALRAAGAAGSYEIALRRADGTPVHTYNKATPIHDAGGSKTGAIGLFSDIGAQKADAARLRDASDLLAQKSHTLEVTLESLPQGVLGVDALGRSHAWNTRLVELLELPAGLMQTRPTLQELTRWQIGNGDFDDPRVQIDATGRAEIARFAAGDASAMSPLYQRTRRDGTVIEVRSRFAGDGSLVRTFTDVTASVQAERRLRESETRFRTMADGAPALIWLSAADGTPLWFNQRWLAYTGRTLQAEIALPWRSRLHEADYDRCLAAFAQAVAARSAYEIEFRLQHADGHWEWIADTGIPRFGANGDFDGYTSYGWDISERKAAGQALMAAKDEAERANRAKSQFLSRMSHELRTPLNAILGFAQLMESDAAERLGSTQRARVQELLRGGRHLLALINEVLDLARIEAGTLQLQLQPVDAAAIVSDCLRMVLPMAQQRRIALHDATGCPAAGHVMADPTRLRQVLLNLLSNAIKYNHEGGNVQVRCGAGGGERVAGENSDGDRGDVPAAVAVAMRERDAVGRHHSGGGNGDSGNVGGDCLCIEVSDGGPGISAEQQPLLFQAFERLGADQSAVEGAGIGLALSKWLVELMGGRIGVRSNTGSGSTFWVELARCHDGAVPAVAGQGQGPSTDAAADDAVHAARSGGSRGAHGGGAGQGAGAFAAPAFTRTVLYIEDNPVNQLLMEGMLAHRPDIRLLVAGLPADGLALAAAQVPDLVLLDIQLPEMDGFEVLRHLRAAPQTRDTPVIAVSANAMQSDIDAALHAGFDRYITKPLDMQRLLALVDAVLAATPH